MAQLPTVEDVARVASVSRQTVSNVLNSPEIVKPATRGRVEAAIAELGYRQNASARRLRTRQSSTIGIRLDPVTNGISGSVLDRYLHALTEQAAERGMRIMLFTATDLDDEVEQYRTLRDGADVDAFIVTATRYADPRIDWLIAERVPFVSFGRPWGADMDARNHLWVDVDGFAGHYEATRHLIGRGLTRIGYFGWPAGSGTGDERRRGWATAMVEAFGLDEAQLELLTTRTEEGVPQARRLIETMFAAEHDLDALVCVSDSVALGAMMAVNEAGRKSFPVIGFDNTAVAQAVGLSSVEQRLDQVAAGTLELLMGATGRRVLPHGEERSDDEAGGPDTRHRLITPKLVVRRSSHLVPVDESESTEIESTEVGSTAAGNHYREEMQ
ncbi:LacI family DNA-binding transcriptional regulator [Salinibacterium sp.]|uniref:LacI family DNA-binding transcriptional regulator n=1 Tax=Salinibacterium sp. TaxID=1915057 RepID=UPI00286D4CCF|nr:LacI family DNA-binding transcriptional regulator [Salinibacterium sp.]